MITYIIRRLLHLVPIVVGVTVIVFSITYLAPGDPAKIMLGVRATPETVAALREKLGLDEPLHIQYITWLSRVIRGDFGRSIQYREEVSELFLGRALASAKLLGAAILISILLGISTGIISAVKQYSIWDHISRIMALFWVSMASFWFGLMLILIFGLYLGWFPTFGYGGIRHVVLPALTLGLIQTALISRLTRSSMLEVINQDYITTARAKGLAERVIIYKHALKNALIPIITIIALRIPWIFSGAMVTETVFAWPGMGNLLVLSVLNRDFPVVQGATLIIAMLVVFSNLLADVLYAIVNPRVTYD
ncbi:ABC transporter permease [Dehalococcoidia bacterium]|nr:ABC transporter permease [Dehalococcoidia bacterium]